MNICVEQHRSRRSEPVRPAAAHRQLCKQDDMKQRAVSVRRTLHIACGGSGSHTPTARSYMSGHSSYEIEAVWRAI